MVKEEWSTILENKFQRQLIKDIRNMIPDCIIMKNDPNYLQGVPDLAVVHGPHCVLLEGKRSKNAPHQPNQDYYINRVRLYGGTALFVSPENKEEVLNEIQSALRIT